MRGWRFVVRPANEICVMLIARSMIICAFVLRVLFFRIFFVCVE
jgi:hypothetical protein